MRHRSPDGFCPPRPESLDLICFSHLRWDFVFQRPQHLLSRCAKQRRVYFFEEPVFGDFASASLTVSSREDSLYVVTPQFPESAKGIEIPVLRNLLDDLLKSEQLDSFVTWYYTPMALAFSSHLRPEAVIYDCMDELSAFKGAPPGIREREAELLRLADVVFTGGHSLYQAKRHQHPNIHPFPSSIDKKHFGSARNASMRDPMGQDTIPHPRIGYCGVIDERMDTALLDSLAEARPEWQFIMVGPIVKIDAADLPKRSNIHYLGSKSYKELPAYLSSWEVAMLPFARNESTRFISPTKTPEYLAAGLPVVSTSITDVVKPYGELGLVHIADATDQFVSAIEQSLAGEAPDWAGKVDRFLSLSSWDLTWKRMWQSIDAVLSRRATLTSGLVVADSQSVASDIAGD